MRNERLRELDAMSTLRAGRESSEMSEKLETYIQMRERHLAECRQMEEQPPVPDTAREVALRALKDPHLRIGSIKCCKCWHVGRKLICRKCGHHICLSCKEP